MAQRQARELLAEAQSLLAHLDRDDELGRDARRHLDMLGRQLEGDDGRHFETLRRLEEFVEELNHVVGKRSDAGRPELPPTALILKNLRAALGARRRELERRSAYESRFKNRLDKIEREIDEIEAAVTRIPEGTDPEQAQAYLQHALRNVLALVELIKKDIYDIDSASQGIPGTIGDHLSFTVTSPRSLVPGECSEIDLWAHLEEQRKQVIEMARDQASGNELRIQPKGPVPISVARGGTLTVRLRIADLQIQPEEETILWEGGIGNAHFVVFVPSDIKGDTRPAIFTVHANGLRVVGIHFVVRFDKRRTQKADVPKEERRHRSAFASYASADRDDVFARIQGMQKVAPDLDVFVDVAKLRSGEKFQQRLQEEILSRDVLYLFWSKAASESPWVDWEWRCGYQQRGLNFIDPVPLAPPQEVAPPRELAEAVHFNDWVLAYISGRRNVGSDPLPQS